MDFDSFDEDFKEESDEQRRLQKHRSKQYKKFKALGVEGIQNIRPVWATGELIDQNMMNRPDSDNNYEHIKVKTKSLIERIDFDNLDSNILFSGDKASNMRYVTTLDLWEQGKPVDPPDLRIDNVNGKLNLKLSDGRHRAILSFLLAEDCTTVCIHKNVKRLIGDLVEICQE